MVESSKAERSSPTALLKLTGINVPTTGGMQTGEAVSAAVRFLPMRYPTDPPLITVFGGGGFIGRYVCEMLLDSGARLCVAERDPRGAYYLQPLADVGRLYVMAVDFRRPEAIIRAIDGAEAVINLPGDSYDDSRRTGHRDHGTLAAAAWIKGVNSFVHVTAINADPDSPSAYGRTKSLAEQAVRAGHPGATIIRPNEVFGPEDNFTNRIAALMSLPIVPVIAPTIRFQPIFVCDLARAIAAAALERKTHAGITYELAGPEAMTMRELYTRVAEIVGNGSKLINVPDFVTVAMASLRSLLGQARALGRDALPSSELPGLEAFGIRPTPLIAMAPLWLERYCRGGRLARRKLLILGDRKIRMPIEARTGQT